jgi:hypothetical protein
MPFIGEVDITVIEEVNRTAAAKTTEHALEEGEPVTDHVDPEPIQITISGYIEGNPEQKRLTLEKYRENGELLVFDYTTRLENVVITNFSTTKREYKDGYTFTMTLKQIRIATRPPAVSVSAEVAMQSNAIASVGLVTGVA